MGNHKMAVARLIHGRYTVFNYSHSKGNVFRFNATNQVGLIRLLEDATWKPEEIIFSYINFSNGHAGNVYQALRKRFDLEIKYIGCVLPKAIIERKPSNPKYNLQTLQPHLEKGIAYYQQQNYDYANGCFNYLISLVNISNAKGDDNIWRFLLNTYHHSALVHTELEFGLSTPNKDGSIHFAWKCFLKITEKTKEDFSTILLASKLIVFTENPILNFIRSLACEQHDLKSWSEQFNNIIESANFSNKSFIIDLIKCLITFPNTFENPSLKAYLTDKECLEALANNLNPKESQYNKSSPTLYTTTKSLPKLENVSPNPPTLRQ